MGFIWRIVAFNLNPTLHTHSHSSRATVVRPAVLEVAVAVLREILEASNQFPGQWICASLVVWWWWWWDADDDCLSRGRMRVHRQTDTTDVAMGGTGVRAATPGAYSVTENSPTVQQNTSFSQNKMNKSFCGESTGFSPDRFLGGDLGGSTPPYASPLKCFSLHLDFGYTPLTDAWEQTDR